MERLAGDRIEVRSAGSDPASEVNPVVAEALRELGIEIESRTPRKLDDDLVREAEVVVTMGCGDECPFYPGKRYEDWELRDPAGLELDEVRPIRDEIEARVERLAASLTDLPEHA